MILLLGVAGVFQLGMAFGMWWATRRWEPLTKDAIVSARQAREAAEEAHRLARGLLARRDALALVRDPTTPAHRLTFAAEECGGLPEARDALIALLAHPSAVVREGALIGLAQYDDAPDLREAVARLVDDPSPAVAEQARAMLEEWR